MSKVKSHLSYANVTATIAAFLALGGGAIAAINVPKKSVGPKQLKSEAVKTNKIANEAVATGKLANEAVTDAKVATGTLTAGKIAPGQVVKDIVIRETVQAGVGNNAFAIERPACAAGEFAIAGGGGFTVAGTRDFSNNDIETDIRTFAPLDANEDAVAGGGVATKWLVSGQNLSGASRDFHAYVVCARR